MFVLTNVGWLLFRETSLEAIARDLTLSPFAASSLDRWAAFYLFLVVFVYSIPLWVQSLWIEMMGRDERPVAGWPRIAWQGATCGLAFAAILVLRSQTSLDFIYFQF